MKISKEKFDEMIEEVVKFETDLALGRLNCKNWNYLRIYPDGEIIRGEDISPCYPESEYFHKEKHPITFWEKKSHEDYSNSPEFSGRIWEDNENGEWIRNERFSDYEKYENGMEERKGWKRFSLGDLVESIELSEDEINSIAEKFEISN